ncbi:guanylate cyclase-like protein, putative [Bodo saltans]|uniref:adenylate cyclase n=1 Tax=Bodo saltans TaxID=75058 RepID=A0A0S4IQ33_BODSA|nr:guanylate cyclase-like protein, putative [Bodo saltans]|eukprot:CUF92421.1 guanylate cyclase-like protein, putative [Bodo saltans]
MESQYPQTSNGGTNSCATNPLVDMILRSRTPSTLCDGESGDGRIDEAVVAPQHQERELPQQPIITDNNNVKDFHQNNRQKGEEAASTYHSRSHATRSSASNQSQTVEATALAKIRSIMCGLQDQRWVPTYIPFLSDRMIFELFWPTLSPPPTQSDLETVPSQQQPSDLMRDIKPVLDTRCRAALSSLPPQSSTNHASADTTFWLRHDAISMRFDDQSAEGEFCVHQYRHRLRGAVLAICIVTVIAVNMARSQNLKNSWRIHHSDAGQRSRVDPSIATICSIIPIMSLTCLAVVFVGLSRLFHRHDTGVQQLSRERLRTCVAIQEICICIAMCLFVPNIGTIIVTEWWCPVVHSEEAKIIHCISNLGYTSMTFIMMLIVPIIVFPIRFAAMLLLYVAMISELLIIIFFLFNDDAVAMVTAKHRSQPSSSVALCRIVLCILTACWLLFLKWKLEKVERLEFAMACKLEATSLELRHLRQTLGDQITTAVPTFVARRLISGQSVRQDNAHAVILIAGMVDVVSFMRTAGPADVVTLLNRIFFALDQCVNDPNVRSANIEKMQTIGDTYVCVFGLHSQRLPYEYEMFAAAPVMRQLATNMLFLTTAVSPLSIGLHVGQATGVVLGKSLTYVAVGSGIRECMLLMRRAKRRGTHSSPDFEEALNAATLVDPMLNFAHETQSQSEDHHQHDRIAAPSQLGIDEMAELGKFQGLNVQPSSSNESNTDGDTKNVNYEMMCSVASPCFNDPDLEAEYINSLLEVATPDHTSVQRNFNIAPTFVKDVYGAAHRTVYIGAAAVTIINIVVFLVMDIPCQSYLDGVGALDEPCGAILGLWSVAAVVALIAHHIEKLHLLELWLPNLNSRSWCRSGILIFILALHIIGYVFLSSSSFLLHNVLSDIALIGVVSLSRTTTNPLGTVLQDVILLVVPMMAIQFRLISSAQNDSDYDNISQSQSGAGGGGHDDGMYLTYSDRKAIARSWVIALAMFVVLDIAFRYLSDLDRRQRFATRHSLSVETKQLELQRATMAQFVDSIVPKFASDAFQQFIIHHQSHKRRGRDFVHPWLGSWFATKVMDLPVIVLQIATPIETVGCSREHCQTMHQQQQQQNPPQQPHNELEIKLSPTAERVGALSDTNANSSRSKRHSFSSLVNPLASTDSEYTSVPASKFQPGLTSSEDCTVEQRGYLERLQYVHGVIDRVVGSEAFRATVCKAKSSGDVVIFTTTCVEEDATRTPTLLQCAMEMMRNFAGGPCGPRVVLNSGLVVGAVIGTDRLTFELFGEAVATSLELLEAMHHQSLIVTDRVAQELLHCHQRVGGDPLNAPPSFGASAIWRIRGGQGVVRVHHVTLT